MKKGEIYVSRKNQHFEKNQNTWILAEKKLYNVTHFQIILKSGKRYMIIIA